MLCWVWGWGCFKPITVDSVKSSRDIRMLRWTEADAVRPPLLSCSCALCCGQTRRRSRELRKLSRGVQPVGACAVSYSSIPYLHIYTPHIYTPHIYTSWYLHIHGAAMAASCERCLHSPTPAPMPITGSTHSHHCRQTTIFISRSSCRAAPIYEMKHSNSSHKYVIHFLSNRRETLMIESCDPRWGQRTLQIYIYRLHLTISYAH